MARLAPSHDTVYPGPSFPGAGAAAPKKGAPGLTWGQALVLRAAVLPWKRLTPHEAVRQVQFIRQQNHAAYLSHRKRTLKRLDGL